MKVIGCQIGHNFLDDVEDVKKGAISKKGDQIKKGGVG